MKTHAQDARDVGPWYRQRWPWLLMAGPAVVIVAGGVTAWLAVKSFDGLVADDYYKQGLGINQTLARAALARELGLTARVSLTSERVSVEALTVRGVLPERVRLSAHHATQSSLDREFLLTGSNGHYSGPGQELASGRWQLVLEDEARTWRLSAAIRLPEDANVQLAPAADVVDRKGG